MKTVVHLPTQELDRLRAYAEQFENFFIVDSATFVPGDRPEYVATLTTTVVNSVVGVLEQRLRVVFSVTKLEGAIYRHASISLISGNTSGFDVKVAEGVELRSAGLPAPSAVEGICYGLGFTGVLTEWLVAVEEERVIVVMQRIDPEASA